MRSHWTILDTGCNSAERNMALDAKLLEDLVAKPTNKATLHLYDWDGPSATYGYFTTPEKLLCMQSVGESKLQCVRRPTGGGVIFHLSDFAFSIVVPQNHEGYSLNTLENYAFVNALVAEVVAIFCGKKGEALSLLPVEPVAMDIHARHFCMAKPTKYDVMLEGRKVGGGAQRRTKHGFLHQGSISLALPNEALLRKVLLPDTAVWQAMQTHTYTLLEGTPSQKTIQEARQHLKSIFQKVVMSYKVS